MNSRRDPASRGPFRDLRLALDRVTRPPLLGAVAALMLVLVSYVSAVHLLKLEPPAHGNLQTGTGDFLAFWTGAVSIHDGAGASLYDLESQRRLQADVLGGNPTGFQPYLNPPLLAIVLAPLVPLGYLRAFYLFDLGCIVSLATGIAMLTRLVPTIAASRSATWTLALLVAGYLPMLQTTIGGQNTPVTFALLTGFALAWQRGSKGWAVVALGLLTYKPQYAIGIGTALLLAGQWRVAMAGAAAGIGHWLLGASWSGIRWPLDMLAMLRSYRPQEIAQNAGTHFSWVRTSDFLWPSPLDTVAGLAGVAVVLGAWWRFRDLGRRGDAAWVCLVVCGTMLASPHQQYYDVALLTLPVAVLVDRHLALRGAMPSLRTRLLLATAWVGYPIWNYSERLRIQPLFLVLLGVAAWSIVCCREAETRATAVEGRR